MFFMYFVGYDTVPISLQIETESDTFKLNTFVPDFFGPSWFQSCFCILIWSLSIFTKFLLIFSIISPFPVLHNL